MEPPRKKHRTSNFTYPGINQIKLPIQAMKPPVQGLESQIQSPHQEIQAGATAKAAKTGGIGLPAWMIQQPTQKLVHQVEASQRTSKSLVVAAELSQKLLPTRNVTPVNGSLSRPMQSYKVPGARNVFNVPSDKVGLLIGRGGSKIREIQQLSGANVYIAKVSLPATQHLREVTLSGTEEQVASAREKIDALMNDPAYSNGPRPDGRNFPNEPKKTLQIPSTAVGLVIGRGGEQIRQIIQETSCIIHIEKEAEAQMAGRTPPHPGYQNVYLRGTDEAVVKAEKAIMDLVNGDRHIQRINHIPNYGHFGQFVLPQYNQAYGFQAYGAQQMFGLQQPYMAAGQPLIQPSFGVMQGIASMQQCAPQTYMATLPGAVGIAQQYTSGCPTPQHQTATIQYNTTVSIPQYGQAGVASAQGMLPVPSPLLNQPLATEGGPQKQLSQESLPSTPQQVQAERYDQSMMVQSHPSTIVYKSAIRGPANPLEQLSATMNSSVPKSCSSATSGISESSQFCGQQYAHRGQSINQLAQGNNQKSGLGVVVQTTSSSKYNPGGGISTQYQQQFAGVQNNNTVIYNPQ